MIKVTVLLPTTYNDSQPVLLSAIHCLLDKLDDITGGHTSHGICIGSYRMESGYVIEDKNIVVWVVCDSSKLSELREWASLVAQLLKQESVYFEYQQTNVEFIRA